MKNPLWNHLRIIICAVTAAFWGCGGGAEDQYIAKVNKSVLTYDMLRQRIDTTAAIEPQAREFAQNWVNNELLYQEAANQGYDNVPAVTQPLQEIKQKLAVNIFLQKELFEKVMLTMNPEEEQRYYDSHKQEFLLKEDKVKLSYIVFDNRDTAAGYRSEILRGIPWNEALSKRTRNKESGVVLEFAESQFFSQTTIAPAELWRVLQTMNPNDVSFPVRTAVGFYVLNLQGRQLKGEIATLESVRNEIQQRMIMEKRQKGIDSLLTELKKRNTVQLNLSTIPRPGESNHR